MTNQAKPQKFNFFCAGGVEQLSIQNADDLAAVEALDPKLWLAISMPTSDLCSDARTLAFIDSDHDGRIRVPEIKNAVAFVRANLADFSAFFSEKTAFPLSALRDDSPLLPIARQILSDAGATDDTVTLALAQKAFSGFDARPFNGDGLLSLVSANGDAAIEALLKDLFSVLGASVAQGIAPGQVEAFVADAQSALAWHEAGASDASAIFPLGEKTESAFAVIESVREKVEDFFARARLASYDPTAVDTLNPSRDAIAQLAQGSLTPEAAKAFPIARISASAGEPELPLVEGVNPAWANALAALRDQVVVPASGLPASATTLTETQWRALLAQFSAYAAWLAKKPAGKILELPPERLRAVLAQNPTELLAPLFERDKAEAPLRTALENLERLCLYCGNLLSLLRNYVSFADFYTLSPKTTFLAGKLYIDSRECALCIRVKDPAAHAALAAKSNCFIAYCKCTRPSDAKTMMIAAVLGDGDSDFLAVGRNGVFVDKDGNDWDATIVKIAEQPISLRQAIWTPYRKLAGFVETQINNFAAAREKKVDQGLSTGVGNVAGTATGTPPKPAFDLGKFVGIFAAIGLALGAIGAALAALGAAFMSLTWWQMPLVILGIFVVISLPSVIITAMKLRRRTLGPILDANAWAVNARAKINIALGKAYTQLPQKPKGSKRIGQDPFPENRSPLKKIVFAIVALLLVAGIAAFFCLRHTDSSATEAPAIPTENTTQTPPPPATPSETPKA